MMRHTFHLQIAGVRRVYPVLRLSPIVHSATVSHVASSGGAWGGREAVPGRAGVEGVDVLLPLDAYPELLAWWEEIRCAGAAAAKAVSIQVCPQGGSPPFCVHFEEVLLGRLALDLFSDGTGLATVQCTLVPARMTLERSDHAQL